MVISEYIRVPVAQAASEKVTNTVGTFLKENMDGYQVPATKTAFKKVTNTVGTFLKEDRDRLLKIGVMTTQTEQKRLPVWREPF
jgi:hypothetical protein